MWLTTLISCILIDATGLHPFDFVMSICEMHRGIFFCKKKSSKRIFYSVWLLCHLCPFLLFLHPVWPFAVFIVQTRLSFFLSLRELCSINQNRQWCGTNTTKDQEWQTKKHNLFILSSEEKTMLAHVDVALTSWDSRISCYAINSCMKRKNIIIQEADRQTE